jgi:outer membrane murein-binding lipoprotein Lpp
MKNGFHMSGRKTCVMIKEEDMNSKKWTALFIGAILAVLLAGCLNPISFTPSAEAASETVSTDAAPDSGFVTVGIRVEWFPEASRSVAGLAAEKISGGGIRNTAQVIVVNEDGNIVAFTEVRRKSQTESSADLAVNVPVGQTYHFLTLMGFWERDYVAEAAKSNGDYVYSDTLAPTLLAAGVNSQKIDPGTTTVDITMYPLVVDTEFVAGDTELKPVQPQVGKESRLGPGTW